MVPPRATPGVKIGSRDLRGRGMTFRASDARGKRSPWRPRLIDRRCCVRATALTVRPCHLACDGHDSHAMHMTRSVGDRIRLREDFR